MSLEPVTLPKRDSVPLPQREEAERCASMDAGRRCVLPPGHPSAHVYPPAEVTPAAEVAS